MNIGIIGAGNMGSAFAKRLAAAGHQVTITAKGRSHAEEAASGAGKGVRALSPGEIGGSADVLILATPYAASREALKGAGDVAGKVVVEISNPLKPDMSGLVVGLDTSAAEEIQKGAPGARVVKAFNTMFAQVLREARKAQVFCAGDDAGAKQVVREIVESLGFEAVDAGPLANARYLEPLGMLTIYLGYSGGMGTKVAPAVDRVL